MKKNKNYSILNGLRSSKVCLSILSSALVLTSICLPLTMVSCKKVSSGYVVLTGSPDVTLGENKIDGDGNLSFTITAKDSKKEVVSVIAMKGNAQLTLEECTFTKSTQTVTITNKALSDHSGEIIVTPALQDVVAKGVEVTKEQFVAALDKISGRADNINYTVDYQGVKADITFGELTSTTYTLAVDAYKEEKSITSDVKVLRASPGDEFIYEYEKLTGSTYQWRKLVDGRFYSDNLYKITPSALKEKYDNFEFNSETGKYDGTITKDYINHNITLSFKDTQNISTYIDNYFEEGSSATSAYDDIFQYSKIGNTTVTLPKEPSLPLPYLNVNINDRNIDIKSAGEDLSFSFKGQTVSDVTVTCDPTNVLTYTEGKLVPNSQLSYGKAVDVTYSKDKFHDVDEPMRCYVGSFSELEIYDDYYLKQKLNSEAESIIVPPGFINSNGTNIDRLEFLNNSFNTTLKSIYFPKPLFNDLGIAQLYINAKAFGEDSQLENVYVEDTENWYLWQEGGEESESIPKTTVVDPKKFAAKILNLNEGDTIYYSKQQE